MKARGQSARNARVLAAREPSPGAPRRRPESPNQVRKIVVFTGDLKFSVRKAVVELVEQSLDLTVLLLEYQPGKSRKWLLRNQVRNIRSHGWRWTPHAARVLLGRWLASRRSEPFARPDAPGECYTRSSLLRMDRVWHRVVTRIHGREARSIVTEFEPDLGLSVAAPILKPRLFQIPRLGTFNLHKGKLPEYRGVPPAFWELRNGERSVGCTIHRVDASLDTGPILIEGEVPVGTHATVESLQLQLDELGIDLLIEAVARVNRGEIKLRDQAGGRHTFRSATLKEEASLKRQLRPRRSLRNRVAQWGKDGILTGYTHLLRPLPRRVLARRERQQIVILLYHRVNDDLRDSVTVGIEQFSRQMATVARHYPRLSLGELLSRDFDPASSRPHVLVTFDDGYLDNYLHASRILLRHRIPATFFISTGMIETDQGFRHDWERLGKAVPTMTWGQVKEMHEMGFTFGSHTVNHINLAQAEEGLARRELVESRSVLEEKLGFETPVIAYPFGKRGDITPERLEMIRATGYVACFSAYGGWNPPDYDRFDLKRMGVDYNFSEAAFRARLEGFTH